MSTASNQLPLFGNDCATNCEAYAACGGNRPTVPCGCAWPLQSGMRYQCHKCYLICRDKKRKSLISGQPDEADFVSHIDEGYLLDQITIIQTPPSLPLFIPTYTHKCKGIELPVRWAAADIRVLFKSRRKGAATIQPYFASEEQTRNYLQVNPDCQLLAVLNGQDWMLESFWAMPRRKTLEHLAGIGFRVGTGPSYSVTALTTRGSKVPYSHHTAMLLRHHRVLDEMQDAGICAAPNIYWLDGDLRELNRWADWLKSNPAIGIVSRDFTATNHWSVIAPKVNELLYILRRAGRPLHVIVVGSGRANAPRILQEIFKAGHTASIVTSAPVLKALKGVKYMVDAAGNSSEASCGRDAYTFPQLIEHNITVFEEILFKAIDGMPAAQRFLHNMPLITVD